MSTKFTPGPWQWESGYTPGKNGTLFGLGGDTVFDTTAYENMWFARYNDEDAANAHLIAAAPDLYEALEAVSALKGTLELHGLHEAVIAALRKARGEQA